MSFSFDYNNVGSPPTLAGFQSFVTNIMDIPVLALPVGAPVITYAFDFACQVVSQHLQGVPGIVGVWSIYTLAVYNLAADTLINYAGDQDGVCYFKDLRTKYGCNSFTAGVVSGTSDVGTSVTYEVSESLKNLSVLDLQSLKTPYGRTYIGLAQKLGTVWGLS